MQIMHKESTMLEETGPNESAWRSRVKLVFLAFAVIGAFFLLAEHRAHLLPWLPWLPWLFLAACPLMHVFMHHGHGGHHDGGDGDSGGTSHHHHGGRL
jgi:hypothetical protein